MPQIGSASPQVIPGTPVGGYARQTLTVTAPGTPGWAYPANGAVQYRPGVWYDNRYTGTVGTSSFSMTANYTYYLPMFFTEALTITTLGLYTTSGTAATRVNMGISQSSSTGLPGTLLGYSTATWAATGALTCVSQIAVPAGWVYLAIGSVTNVTTVYGISTPASLRPVAQVNSTPTNGNAQFGYYSTASATPISSPSIVVMETITFPAAPFIYFQVE